MDVLITFAPLLIIFAGLYYMLVFVGKHSSGMDREYYRRYWQSIKNSSTDGESGMKLAIIDADKLLDHALKERRFTGDNMGERLRSAQSSLGQYQNIWDAHKMRNTLVHEAEVHIKKNDVKYALLAFESGLKDLGAL